MKLLKTAAILGLGLFCLQANAAEDAVSGFTSEVDKVSYTLGADMGVNFKSNGIALNPELLAQGLKEGFAGEKLRMTTEEMQKTLVSFQQDLQKKRAAAFAELSKKNTQESSKFFAENKKKPGVVELKDGLQYKVIKAGSGSVPKAEDTVTVNYEGRLPDGKVFDSSYQRGEPATFPVNKVIQGWKEALQLMPAGSTWEIYVPAELAYGNLGVNGIIGPNQSLIFKVDLLSIKPVKKG